MSSMGKDRVVYERQNFKNNARSLNYLTHLHYLRTFLSPKIQYTVTYYNIQQKVNKIGIIDKESVVDFKIRKK